MANGELTTTQKRYIAIRQSPAHQLLLAAASAANDVEEHDVSDLLWRIRAPRELPRFVRISRRINAMLRAAISTWGIDLSSYGLQAWPGITDFIERHRRELTQSIGQEFNQPAATSEKNPFAGHYLTFWAPYPTFWLDHPSEDETYLLLQAHLLFAFARDVSVQTSIRAYEECTDWYFRLHRHSPVDFSHAVRILSIGGPKEVAVLKSLPVGKPPYDFACWLRDSRYE
jgi:hypothetical protein